MSETALARRDTDVELNEALTLARCLVRSNSFPNARDEFKALAIILAGRQFGWSPVFALMNVNLIDGKLSLSAAAMSAQIKASGRYDYEVLESTDELCRLEFFRLEWDGPKKIRTSMGVSEFTLQEAKRANLAGKFNWKNYPSDMCFARAMSRGARRFCPDVFLGASYAESEVPDRGLGVSITKPTVLADSSTVEGEFSVDPAADPSIADAPRKPRVRFGVAREAEASSPSPASTPAPGATAVTEPDAKSEAPVAVSELRGAEPAAPMTDLVVREALRDLFDGELASRLEALAPGAALPSADAPTVLAAVEASLGSKKAAKAAWDAVGAKVPAQATAAQVIALAQHVAVPF